VFVTSYLERFKNISQQTHTPSHTHPHTHTHTHTHTHLKKLQIMLFTKHIGAILKLAITSLVFFQELILFSKGNKCLSLIFFAIEYGLEYLPTSFIFFFFTHGRNFLKIKKIYINCWKKHLKLIFYE
jgi:hypothetical protein